MGSQMRVEHRRFRRRDRWRIGGELGEGALTKRRQDPFPHAPQRIAHVALGELFALPFLGRAGRHRDRTVDRLNDVRHRDLRRSAGQLITAAGALMRSQQAAADQPLQHLRHQLDRDVVELGDLAGARRPRAVAVAAQGEMFHPDQGVVGLLGEPQHDASSGCTAEPYIRPPESDINIQTTPITKAKQKDVQYFGWLGSTLSTQSRIPPLRFSTRLNPTERRKSAALALRTPLLQCTISSSSGLSSPYRFGTSPNGMSSDPGMRLVCNLFG